MAAPYSQDLRERVGAAIAGGASARAAALRFGISESTASRWAERLRREGQIRAHPMGGDHRSRLTSHREAVLSLLAEEPDLTIEEIRQALQERHGLRVGYGTVWRFLDAHQITLKKKPARRRAAAA